MWGGRGRGAIFGVVRGELEEGNGLLGPFEELGYAFLWIGVRGLGD